jgi:hypothetical protein
MNIDDYNYNLVKERDAVLRAVDTTLHKPKWNFDPWRLIEFYNGLGEALGHATTISKESFMWKKNRYYIHIKTLLNFYSLIKYLNGGYVPFLKPYSCKGLRQMLREGFFDSFFPTKNSDLSGSSQTQLSLSTYPYFDNNLYDFARVIVRHYLKNNIQFASRLDKSILRDFMWKCGDLRITEETLEKWSAKVNEHLAKSKNILELLM